MYVYIIERERERERERRGKERKIFCSAENEAKQRPETKMNKKQSFDDFLGGRDKNRTRKNIKR